MFLSVPFLSKNWVNTILMFIWGKPHNFLGLSFLFSCSKRNVSAKKQRMKILVLEYGYLFPPLVFNLTRGFNYTEMHLVCSANSRYHLRKFNREVRGKMIWTVRVNPTHHFKSKSCIWNRHFGFLNAEMIR